MNTYKIDLTIGPSISLAKMSTAPFLEEHASTGGYSYLAINVNLKHVEIETQAAKPTRRTDLDQQRGVIKIHLPLALSGYHFTEVLHSDRGMRALSYLAYQADFTGEEVTVVSPRQYIDALYFLSARFTDAVIEEVVTIPAEAIHLKEWRVKLTPVMGKPLRQLKMLGKVGDVAEMYDLETDKPIVTRADLNDAIEARARKAAVEGLHIDGLKDRFEMLYRRCVQNEAVDIPDIPEEFKERETAKHASRSVAVSMRSILIGCLELRARSKKLEATSLCVVDQDKYLHVECTDECFMHVQITSLTVCTEVVATRLSMHVDDKTTARRAAASTVDLSAGMHRQASGAHDPGQKSGLFRRENARRASINATRETPVVFSTAHRSLRPTSCKVSKSMEDAGVQMQREFHF